MGISKNLFLEIGVWGKALRTLTFLFHCLLYGKVFRGCHMYVVVECKNITRWLAKLLQLYLSWLPSISTPRGQESISKPNRAKRSVANPALRVQRHAGWRNFYNYIFHSFRQ